VYRFRLIVFIHRKSAPHPIEWEDKNCGPMLYIGQEIHSFKQFKRRTDLNRRPDTGHASRGRL
jgi:hypothetical protein